MAQVGTREVSVGQIELMLLPAFPASLPAYHHGVRWGCHRKGHNRAPNTTETYHISFWRLAGVSCVGSPPRTGRESVPGPLPSLWQVAGNLWRYVACRRVTSSPHGLLPVCLCPNLLFIKEQEPVYSSRTSSSLIASVMTLFPKRS